MATKEKEAENNNIASQLIVTPPIDDIPQQGYNKASLLPGRIKHSSALPLSHSESSNDSEDSKKAALKWDDIYKNNTGLKDVEWQSKQVDGKSKPQAFPNVSSSDAAGSSKSQLLSQHVKKGSNSANGSGSGGNSVTSNSSGSAGGSVSARASLLFQCFDDSMKMKASEEEESKDETQEEQAQHRAIPIKARQISAMSDNEFNEEDEDDVPGFADSPQQSAKSVRSAGKSNVMEKRVPKFCILQ